MENASIARITEGEVAVIIEADHEVAIWRINASPAVLHRMSAPISGYCYTLAGATRQARRSLKDAIEASRRAA